MGNVLWSGQTSQNDKKSSLDLFFRVMPWAGSIMLGILGTYLVRNFFVKYPMFLDQIGFEEPVGISLIYGLLVFIIAFYLLKVCAESGWTLDFV